MFKQRSLVRSFLILFICLLKQNVSKSSDNSGIHFQDSSLCSDSLWNTCVGRCGDDPPKTISTPYVLCACDERCEFYGDCCADFRTECDSGKSFRQISRSPLGRFSCVDGILMIDECPPWWESANEMELCKTTVGPASFTSNYSGLAFRNVHCARCNGFDDSLEWNLQNSCSNSDVDCIDSVISLNGPEVRRCLFDSGACSAGNHAFERCSAYSKPVFGNEGRLYKNIDCASCSLQSDMKNDTEFRCINWSPRRNRLLSTFNNLRQTSTMLRQTLDQTEDIPASFTVLFSFGADGTQKTMFNSEERGTFVPTQAKCGDLEIWEPFTETCHRVYCSSEFVLVDFKCVKIYDNSSVGHGTEVDITNLTATRTLWMPNSAHVNMTLYVQLDQPVTGNVSNTLHRCFLRRLALSLDASYDRFTNFTFVINESLLVGDGDTAPYDYGSSNQLVDATVSFILREQSATSKLPADKETSLIMLSEPTIERIVSSIVSGISLSRLFLHLDDVSLHVVGVAEEFFSPETSNDDDELIAAAILAWCDVSNGSARTILYQNSDFEVVFRNDNDEEEGDVAIHIRIVATDRIYHPGEYLASIVFQGNQWQKEANVSGFVVVCDRTSDNNNCPRIAVPITDYQLLPNSSLHYVGHNLPHLPSIIHASRYILLADRTALICYDFHLLTTIRNQFVIFGNETVHFIDEAYGERLVNVVLTSVSLVATLLTFVTYASFADLRNLPGVYVMNLTACLWMFQFVFLIGERRSVVLLHPVLCSSIAVFVHFASLCYFCWMSVVAIDVHQVFASSKNLLKSTGGRSSLTTFWYFLYAYGCPTMIVGTCAFCDLVMPTSFAMRTDYGNSGYCWIGNRTIHFVAFVMPVFVLLTSNVILYILVTLSIRRIKRTTKLATVTVDSVIERRQYSTCATVIFLRLGTVLGFTWLFGLFITVPFHSSLLRSISRYAFIILNASHGTAIFLVFVCNRKVLAKYLRLFGGMTAFGRMTVVEGNRFRPQRHEIIRTRSTETHTSNLSISA